MHASHLDRSANTIRSHWNRRPYACIVLGSGLSSLADNLTVESVIGYLDIPFFQQTTAIGHRGRLVCGELAGVPIIAMDGRLHLYEGHSFQQISWPIRVARRLGAEILIISNASGGMHPRLSQGDLLLIEDHIDLLGPRRPGQFDAMGGPKVPTIVGVRGIRCLCYDAELISLAEKIARQKRIVTHRGVYAAMLGPNYETRAEYRFLRRIGADVAGMSTVPEAVVARQIGLRTLAISVVTNVCNPDWPNTTSADSVIAAASRVESKVRSIVKSVLIDYSRRLAVPRVKSD